MCCPNRSWGSLIANLDYEPKGKVVQLDDLPIYVVGKSEKCLLWNYHIFGFNDGRGKQLCDMFADQGYMVVMPDYFRGKSQDPTLPGAKDFLMEETQWPKLKKDIESHVLPWAKEQGAKIFGAIGTCWGSYVVLRISSHPDFKAGVSFHPSHTILMSLMNDDERVILEGLKGTPQLFAPAGNDHENVKPGGLAQKYLGDDLTIIEFPEMKHGWTIRGDLKEPGVEAATMKAMKDGLEFFKKHLI